MTEGQNILVLDLGSTHLKACVVSYDLEILFEVHKDNIRIKTDYYEALDVEDIGSFIFKALADSVDKYDVKEIVVSTHGSSLALLDYDAHNFSPFNSHLAMPVMFYGQEIPKNIQAEYALQAPNFLETFADINPLALTGALQLFWQSKEWNKDFKQTKKIVMWPSYWGFRLTGITCNDYSSLGAQNQIWNPRLNEYASVIRDNGWEQLFATATTSAKKIGILHPDICKKYGLKNQPDILCGVHDSDANYWRFLKMGYENATIVSTGTWIINFNPKLDIRKLEGKPDCCTNTNVQGYPVACSRYQGGIELAIILEMMGNIAVNTIIDIKDVLYILNSTHIILPSFAASGGPVAHTEAKGQIIGDLPKTTEQKYVLAILYIAMMTQLSWDYLEVGEQIIIDGPFTKNPLFLQFMALFNPNSQLYISVESNGTLLGTALLSEHILIPSDHGLNQIHILPEYQDISEELQAYKKKWMAKIITE